MKWYVMTEQVANDMGWLHPVKRVRNFTTAEVPGNIKKRTTAYKHLASPTPEKVMTCKELWKLNRTRPPGDQIQDQLGYTGHPFWTDEKCKHYHTRLHTVGGFQRLKLFPGWRVHDVTTDRDEALAFVTGLRRGGEA